MSFSPTNKVSQEDKISSTPTDSINITPIPNATVSFQEDIKNSPPKINKEDQIKCSSSESELSQKNAIKLSVSISDIEDYINDQKEEQFSKNKNNPIIGRKNNTKINKNQKRLINSNKKQNNPNLNKPSEAQINKALKDETLENNVKDKVSITVSENEISTDKQFYFRCRHASIINEIMTDLNNFIHKSCEEERCIAKNIHELKKTKGHIPQIHICRKANPLQTYNFSISLFNKKVGSNMLQNTDEQDTIKNNIIRKDSDENKNKNMVNNLDNHCHKTNKKQDSAVNNIVSKNPLVFLDCPSLENLSTIHHNETIGKDECGIYATNEDEEENYQDDIPANEEKDEKYIHTNLECFMCNLDDNTADETSTFNEYEVYALSLDEINAINTDTKGDGNIHNARTEAIKSNLINLNHIKQTNENTVEMLEIFNTRDSVKKADEIREQINILDTQIDEEEKKLKDVENLKNEFKEKLRDPILGYNDHFEVESAALSCQKFSDIGDPLNNTLEQFWHKICDFSEINSLSEKGIKSLLSCLLIGPAFEVYVDNREKSLKEIMQILTDRFGEMLTITDKIKALNEIKRNHGEKLSSVMARCSSLVEATKHTVPKEQREVRYELLMIANLMKLCSEKAKNEISKERARAARAGYSLPYKSLYLQAIAIENIEKEYAKSKSTSTFYHETNPRKYISIAERRKIMSNNNPNSDYCGPTTDINDDDDLYNDDPTSEDEQPDYDSF